MAFDEAKLQEFPNTSVQDAGTAQPSCVSCDPSTQEANDRFVQPVSEAGLILEWISALEGVAAKLQRGARVAHVACGDGSASILMAQAFPNSRFFGFDTDEASVETARQAARRAGVRERVYSQLGSSRDFPGWSFDLVTCFSGLLTLAHPAGAARRVRSALAPEGTWLIVEAPDSEAEVGALIEAAGFTRFRRAAQTPFNLVFEVGV